MENIDTSKVMTKPGKLYYVKFGIFLSLYGFVKYLPFPIGDFLRSTVVKLFSKKCRTYWIKDGVSFWHPSRLVVGQKVSINENCFIDSYGGVQIGDYCRIAHNCSFISEDHEISDLEKPIYLQGKIPGKIVIGKNVWFGCGVRVLKGVTIGDNSIIGAGSVVTTDIPKNSISFGVPAKVIKKRVY